MSQEGKTRNMTEIMEELGRISLLSKADEKYLIVFGVCASFYKWLFYLTETKVSNVLEKMVSEEQYWGREVGHS